MTNTYKFYVEATCNQCGKLDKVDLNEAKLQEQLHEKFHQNRGHICVLCELKNTSEQNELYKRTRQAKLWENTRDYIARYLNPMEAWPAGISGEQMYYEIRNADVDRTAISNYSKSMDYLDFLATTHWKVVTARARYEAKYRCRFDLAPVLGPT